MKKVVIYIMTMCIMLTCTGLVTWATEIDNSSIQPYWLNTGAIEYGFEFEEDQIGYADIAVTGQPGTSKITIDVHIYRQNNQSWDYVTSNSSTRNAGSHVMSVELSGNSGQYYKAVFTVTVYNNNVPEVITKTCYATCP